MRTPRNKPRLYDVRITLQNGHWALRGYRRVRYILM
jgi:hypothetical protein